MRNTILAIGLLAPGIALAAAGDGGISGGGTATNRSGTIATPSTSQVVIPARTSRTGCEIQSIGTADMWIAIDSAASNAAGSFYLPAGSLFRCGLVQQAVPTGAISIWSTVGGASFTAMEYAR